MRSGARIRANSAIRRMPLRRRASHGEMNLSHKTRHVNQPQNHMASRTRATQTSPAKRPSAQQAAVCPGDATCRTTKAPHGGRGDGDYTAVPGALPAAGASGGIGATVSGE